MYRVVRCSGLISFRDEVEAVELTVSEEAFAGMVSVAEPPAAAWPARLEAALKEPVGSPPLTELARGHKRVTIIVPDATRGVPVADILPQVVTELTDGAIGLEQITVVVATGVHRPATEAEITALLGPLAGKVKAINHNPYDVSQLVYLGTTSCGTPVEVNRTVYESDFRIAVGKVEPHEFAGFSGGRKAVLPGIAGERTIETNHRPEMLLAPEARPGVLAGNPVSEDMDEAAAMLGVDFIVNVVQGAGGQILGVFAGALQAAHRAAVEFMRSFCTVELGEKPDIVVTTPGKPLNIDLYQSLKAVIALGEVVRPGGAIVLYSACPDGLGTTDMFKPYQGAGRLEDVIANLKADYKIQMDHALLVCKVLARGITVLATSPNVPAAAWEKIRFRSASSAQEALDRALATCPQAAPRVLFYPQPQRTLPRVTGGDHPPQIQGAGWVRFKKGV